jgi:hypothetical protein
MLMTKNELDSFSLEWEKHVQHARVHSGQLLSLIDRGWLSIDRRNFVEEELK